MPSNVAVPYMNAWVMMLTFASRRGTYSPSKYAIRSSSGRGWGAGSGAADEDGCWVSMWRLHVACGAGAARAFVEAATLARGLSEAPGRPSPEPPPRGSPEGQDSGDREDHEREVHEVQPAADEQGSPVEAAAPGHRAEDQRDGDERDRGRGEREDRVLRDRPRRPRQHERDDGRDRGLEDHRPGDVA